MALPECQCDGRTHAYTNNQWHPLFLFYVEILVYKLTRYLDGNIKAKTNKLKACN